MQNATILWLMLTLSLCLIQVSQAQVQIDLTQAEGFGISPTLVQMNNIIVHSEVEDATTESGTRIISVPYNITFKFDPVTLNLVPVLSVEPERNKNCADLKVRVLEHGSHAPLAYSHVTVHQETFLTNEVGEVQFNGLLPQHTSINVTRAEYTSVSQVALLSCDNPTLAVIEMTRQVNEPSPPQPKPDDEQPTPEPNPNKPDIGDVIPPAVVQEVKMVLRWGEIPRDLDAHLTGPNPFDGGRFHVFFDNKAVGGVLLDTDLFSASKPEVLYVRPVEGTQRLHAGTYRYTVHQYAGLGNIAESDISVEVWIDGQLKHTYRPAGNAADLNGTATDIWQVFEMIVDEAGRLSFLPIKSYANGVNPYDVR